MRDLHHAFGEAPLAAAVAGTFEGLDDGRLRHVLKATLRAQLPAFGL
jgi:hypothetical protein